MNPTVAQRIATDPKPEGIDEYGDWLWNEFEVAEAAQRGQFDRSVKAVSAQLQESGFWKALTIELAELSSAYYVRTGGFLLGAGPPEIKRKSWESFWLKTFRRNVLDNSRWPRPPIGGWYLPENWLIRISDSVRSKVVVRYLDGIRDVVGIIESTAVSQRDVARVSYKAEEEGYYAAHVDLLRRYEVPRADFDTEHLRIPVEIQVTTQVKDVVAELLHKYYELRRASTAVSDEGWQWDYLTDEFKSRYVGHMAHYLEGVIMELRGKVS